MKRVILITVLMGLSAAVMAADPKIVGPGARDPTGQVVYPDTVQPGREDGTNHIVAGRGTNLPPLSGVTNASGVLTNSSGMTNTNMPGVTNSPHLVPLRP